MVNVCCNRYGKEKCNLVQALRFCTGCMAIGGVEVYIALPFHDHCTRRGWGVSVTPRPLFTPGKDPVPIGQEAGWAPGPVWTGAENLARTGIRSPDRPACSQSLYRLHYPAHFAGKEHYIIWSAGTIILEEPVAPTNFHCCLNLKSQDFQWKIKWIQHTCKEWTIQDHTSKPAVIHQ